MSPINSNILPLAALKTIVGICGRAGAGKGTAAKGLVEGMGFEKHSFAAPVKDALNSIFGWHSSNWESPEWKETPLALCFGHTPRYLVQTLGTEWGRRLVYPDIWVELAFRRARVSGAPGIVFADVRFANEARAIRKEGGLVLFLHRYDSEGKERILVSASAHEHESERRVDQLRELAHAELGVAEGDTNRLQRQVCTLVIGFMETLRRQKNPRWHGRSI